MALRKVLAVGALSLAAGYALALPQSGVATPPPVSERPPRVSSTSLCGDLWVMALADREQIVSVSQNATGPYSPYATEAQTLPLNRGSLEELIAGGAQLVVTGHGSSTQMQRMLPRFGIEELDLPMTSDLAELANKIPQVGRELGQPARGLALQDAFQRSIAGNSRVEDRSSTMPTVVYYRPDGGGAGAGTIVDAAITAAGYDNMQRHSGPSGWRGVALEQIVMTPPDAYVISYFDSPQPSLKAGLGRNSVLRKAAENGTVLPVPGKFWPCDHPIISEAVSVLAHAHTSVGDARP